MEAYFRRKFTGILPENKIEVLTAKPTTPWMVNFLKYDPATSLQQIKCPVLALYGENDLQVPSKENMKILQLALGKGENPNFTIREMENLNHLFQESDTGLPGEYKKIEETFSPKALKTVSEWIIDQTK